MAIANITTLGNILKEFYLGPIVSQLNNEVMAIELFQKATVDWQGKRAIIPVRTTRNTGVAFLAEGGTLPTAVAQGYQDLSVTARFIYGRFTVSGPVIEAAKTSAGAFVQAVDSEMTGLVEDVKNTSNKAMFDGGSVIGYVWQKQNGVAFQYAGATTDAAGVAFSVGGATATVLFVRMDTYAAVGVATRVDAITNKLLTLNAAVDTSAVPADVVIAVTVPAASILKGGVAGAWDLETSGIMSNLSSASLFGVDRTTATGTGNTLQSVHKLVDPVAAVYATLTLRSIESVLDAINEASGKKSDVILCSDLMKVEYSSLLQGVSAGNLYVPTDKASDGNAGFSRLFYQGIEIKSSRHCPKGIFFLLTSKISWKLASLGTGGFMDQDGSIINRVVNQDAYEGTYRWYYNLVCTEPHANGVLTGISF